jgi:hypothetical protein
MSNSRIDYPKTELMPGAKENPILRVVGGATQLPQSVQAALNSKVLFDTDKVEAITDIVGHGNPALRYGTGLDYEMLDKAGEMMSGTNFAGGPWTPSFPDGVIPGDPPEIVNDIFATAGQDHVAVHDILTGSNGEKFLNGVTHFDWPDDSAAANMFSWTGQEATGPNAGLAAETAEAYGTYLGTHDNELLSLPGGRLGDVNPHLTQGFAQGLAPYVNDIAGTHGALGTGFETPDTGGDIESGRMPIAKGIFSVLSSESTASETFNGAALRESVLAEGRYAQDFRNHVPGLDSYQSPLHDAATLQGLANVGIHNATDATGWNEDRKAAVALAQEQRAFKMGVAALGAVPGVGPGFEVLGAATEDAVVGDPMKAWGDVDNPIPEMNTAHASRQILDSLVGSGVPVNGLPDDFYAPIDPDHPDGLQRIRTFEEMQDVRGQWYRSGDYTSALDQAADNTMGVTASDAAAESIAERYNTVVNDTDPT